MRVLAIDPGYDRLGLSVLEKNDSKTDVLHSECFETSRKLDFKERLYLVVERAVQIIKKYNPDWLAIEKVYFNKNQKTAMAVAETRGALIYKAQELGLKVKEFTPQEIKIAVTGQGNSSKRQVIDMVGVLTDLKDKKALDDEFDAIAIGLTFLAHHRTNKRLAKN